MLRTTSYRRNKGLRAGSFFERIFLQQKLGNGFGYAVIALIAIAFGYLVATEPMAGIGLFAVVVGLFIVIACLLSTETGLYVNMVYAFFSSWASRFFFQDHFQVGIVADVLLWATFLSLFFGKPEFKKEFRDVSHSVVVVAILLYTFFLLIELFNPYARSFDGWFQTFRRFLTCVFLIYIAYSVFKNYAAIKRYLTVLYVLALIVGIYGCIQQWHGMFGFEMNIVWANAKGNLVFINGGDLRKFSTMTDPLAFGDIMAACALFFLIIANYTRKRSKKLMLIAGTIPMLLGMAYSGTRTANVMVITGIAVYVLLTINKKSTRIFAVVSALLFVFLLKVPIYSNGPLNRFRSSFEGKKDASFNVRETNRKSIQPYMYAHPIGGGLCTTGESGLRYNPGHELAGFPPDSSYVRKALETGWIGLLLIMILYFVNMKYGLRGFFRTTSEKRKMFYAATLAVLMSFYIAEFPQEALGQLSDMVIYYPFIAILIRLRHWDERDAIALEARNPEKNTQY
jgi:putative inorganic carbon (hco3(-)) transporter